VKLYHDVILLKSRVSGENIINHNQHITLETVT